MAVLPSKIQGAGKASAGARFRQRKISVKVALPIYNANEVSGTDHDLEPSQLHHLNASSGQQRDLHNVETGVDKNEEDEVHLQQVINAAQRVLQGSNKDKGDKEASSVYIPTPDASRIWPDALKFYCGEPFVEPESYIKFSATVEDTLGVEYNMDETDQQFFDGVLSKQVPKTRSKLENARDDSEFRPCSMLEFEAICDKFEKTVAEKQPYLSMDPSNLLSYKELLSSILKEMNLCVFDDQPNLNQIEQNYISTSLLKEKLSKELDFEPFVTTFDKDRNSTNSIRSIPVLMELFGETVYKHWSARKIARKGKPINPSLKFEDPNANEKDNDNDPYVCFRRREFRQARKTRRADNIGAERIRLLQKSLRRARDIIFSTCKRELLKLESWEAEQEIFKLRLEAKGVKRAVGIKGDDHLFYPHKRRKIIKPEPDIDIDIDIDLSKSRKDKRKNQESLTITSPSNSATQSKDSKGFNGQVQPEASSTQPYVKLPPSKIPDMDLVTVSYVLKEKNETIKRAVFEKLKKRKESDKGYANIAHDPYQPFFGISSNDRSQVLEKSHIPYSSIAAAFFHQFNTTNVISENLKKILEDGKKLYPGMKTFKGSTGELVPSEQFPHIHSLLQNHVSDKIDKSSGYIAQLLSNIENNNFSTYTDGFEKSEEEKEPSGHVSLPIARLRKRAGRANRVFIDRRGLMSRPDDVIDEWMNFSDSDSGEKTADASSNSKDAYLNKADEISRLDSRWRFDDDYAEADKCIRSPFSLDPSRLNSISDDTQSIRFGSMLLSKSYDLLRESAHQRQVLMQQARLRAMQQHQLQKGQQGSSASSGSLQVSNNGKPQVPPGSVKHTQSAAGMGLQSSNSMRKLQGGYSAGNNISSSSKLGAMNGNRGPTAQQYKRGVNGPGSDLHLAQENATGVRAASQNQQANQNTLQSFNQGMDQQKNHFSNPRSSLQPPESKDIQHGPGK